MSLEVIGIDHVQIAVPRALESECLAFYRDLLGSAEIEKPADLKASGGAWFRLANLELHIGIDPETSPASKRHICLRVKDADKARNSIEAQGMTIEMFGAVERLRRFFIRDPAGNRIEIAQRL